MALRSMLATILRLEAFLPDGLDTLAEIVEDMAVLHAATSGEEAADDAGDVTSKIEFLRVLNTNTLHTKTETANTGKDDRLTICQLILEKFLQFRNHTNNGSFRETAVATSLCCDLIECHFALTHDGSKLAVTVPS